MKIFRKILVMLGGKDGGAAAIERAAEVARDNAAKMMIVDFAAPLPETLLVPGSVIAAMHRNEVEAKLANLGKVSNDLRQSGLSVAYELIEGAPEKILERVMDHGHDLLIKSAEEPAGLTQRIFGTTGLRLMRKCPCPVMIVKAAGPKQFKRILAAVEPMPPGQQRDPLNIRILQMATSIARSDGSELHVVYVWPHWTAMDLADPGQGDSQDHENFKREIDTLQESMLGALLDVFDEEGRTFHTHLLKGKPSEHISAKCNELDIDLLVMGTIRRPNLLGFAIGSTAERVLDRVRCSVLTLKPDEFQSFALGMPPR